AGDPARGELLRRDQGLARPLRTREQVERPIIGEVAGRSTQINEPTGADQVQERAHADRRLQREVQRLEIARDDVVRLHAAAILLKALLVALARQSRLMDDQAELAGRIELLADEARRVVETPRDVADRRQDPL